MHAGIHIRGVKAELDKAGNCYLLARGNRCRKTMSASLEAFVRWKLRLNPSLINEVVEEIAPENHAEERVVESVFS